MNAYGRPKNNGVGGLGAYMDAPAYDNMNSGEAAPPGAQTINITAASPSPTATTGNTPAPLAEKAVTLDCGWYRVPGANGQCEFSVVKAGQTVFNLPSRIMAEPIMMLPEWSVPWVSLGVNLTVWYFVGGWVLGMAKDEWKRRRG